MFASAEPKGNRPWLQKLSLHNVVETELNRFNCCLHQFNKSRKDGAIRSLLQRASAQILIVSAGGTLVKRLDMSKKQRKAKGVKSNSLII